MKEGVIYDGENGMLVCCKCAGVRAWSGYDSLGNPLVAVTNAHVKEYRKMFGENMRCEKGCTEWRSSRVLK
ncbi:MAG: hypothetical protein PHO37_07700 [Kiritimatiellae bacterium]|nr:hypothetical protein [Kiritimatiellia bacterium]